MKKRGLSKVTSIVILIAIVVLLILIVFWVVKNIEVKPDNIESCSDVVEKVEINSRYTYYDPSSNEFQFSINIGDIEVDEVLVAISGGGLTKSLTITNEYQQIANLANYQSTGFGSDQIKLPGKNAGLTYIYDMGDFSAKPDSITISPVIDKTQCRACDSLYEITCTSDCSCASTTCVGSNCSDDCGGTCAGILEPDCGTRECGKALNNCGSANECGTCDAGYTCNIGDGTCVMGTLTCADLGGTICTGEQSCSGTILNALDSTRCCNASCEEPIQTCSDLGGTICTGEQSCSGTILNALDSTRCCNASCENLVCTLCDTCGNGLFNICDRAECYACTSDTCYFLNRLVTNECNSCTGATCESYDNNQQTCGDDACELGSCVWDGSSCVVSYSPPPTCLMTANPTSVEIGGSSLLSWTSSNADFVSIDNGVTNTNPNSYETVFPVITTTYTATFTGAGGTVVCSATVDCGGYKCINPVPEAIHLKEGFGCDEYKGESLCGGELYGSCGHNRRLAGIDQYFYDFEHGERKLFFFYTAGVDPNMFHLDAKNPDIKYYEGLLVQFTTLSGYSRAPYRRILKYAGPNCEYGPPTDEEIQALKDLQASDPWKYIGNNIVVNDRHFFYGFHSTMCSRMSVWSDYHGSGIVDFPLGCWYLIIEHGPDLPQASGDRDKSPPVAISWSTPCCVRETCISDMGLCDGLV